MLGTDALYNISFIIWLPKCPKRAKLEQIYRKFIPIKVLQVAHQIEKKIVIYSAISLFFYNLIKLLLMHALIQIIINFCKVSIYALNIFDEY